jgi:hypothetical protein
VWSSDVPTPQVLKKAGIVGAALLVAGGIVAAACYDDPTGGPPPKEGRSLTRT